MSDVVSLVGAEAARAPLLRSPANPAGFDLRELLGRVRDELAAQNAPLRGRHGSMDQPEYALRQEVLKALTHADSLASQLASVMTLRVRAAEEEAAESRVTAGRAPLLADDTVVSLPLGRKLPGGAYHPAGWPARDAA